jgi:glycosyltransferase involved in cell wall biosynthesis
MTAKIFLLDQIAALGKDNTVVVAANTKDPEALRRLSVDAPVIFMPIERNISPLRDLWALIRLLIFFRWNHFDVVHSFTPKVGIVAMVAAYLARVPIRIHTFTGQTWATREGLARSFLRAIDKFTANLATNVLVDGRSQREFLIKDAVVSAAKSKVLTSTSHCSVDGERFRPNEEKRRSIRGGLGIADDAVVFLYVGRLSVEKGLLDLAAAFADIAASNPSAHLLVVGPDEDGLRRPMEELLSRFAERVNWVGYTTSPEAYMAAADVFCLPSYREGFGQVLIEASAAGIPVIATRIYGVKDAVVEGETGLLYPPGDTATLCEHMKTLASSPAFRRELGNTGRVRVLREFAPEHITQALVEYYASLTAKV